MSLFQPCLVLHISADSLDWSEVAQVSLFGERSSVSALRPIEELRVGQLLDGLLGADQKGGRARLHQLLAELAGGHLMLRDVVFVIDFVNVVVVHVRFL